VITLSKGFERFRSQRAAPVTRLAQPSPKRLAIWPTVSLVFLLCLPTIFAPIALTVLNALLVTVALIVALFTSSSIDKRLLTFSAFTAAVAFLGLAMGREAYIYDYLKDLWYVCNPVLVTATGYVLYRMKPDLAAALRAFVIAGVIVSLWQVRAYFFDPSIALLPAGIIRRLIGVGSAVPVLGLSILLVFSACSRQGLRIPRALAWTLFVVMAICVAGVFSRTAVALILVAAAAAMGCFVRREWLRVGVPLLLFVAVGLLASGILDTSSDRALQSFSGKLLRSFEEVVVGEVYDARSINTNFRAFETERVLAQFVTVPPVEMLFGQGFGATVDLGVTMPLMTTETGFKGVRRIGIFHNGYMYLLTKVGLVGLLLYLCLLGYLYAVPRSRSRGGLSDPDVAAARLFQALVVSLVVSTYIVSGIFNRDNMFPYLLLLGVLLSHWSKHDGKVSMVGGQTQSKTG
jgi:hypothetical protein